MSELGNIVTIAGPVGRRAAPKVRAIPKWLPGMLVVPVPASFDPDNDQQDWWYGEHLRALGWTNPLKVPVEVVRAEGDHIANVLLPSKRKAQGLPDRSVGTRRWGRPGDHLVFKNAPGEAARNAALRRTARAGVKWGGLEPGEFRVRSGVLEHRARRALRGGTRPDELPYRVAVTRLGEGHATVAYRGADDWVYLVTDEQSGDEAKSILIEAKTTAPNPHLPQIEWLGYGWAGKRRGEAYRMPLYRKVERGTLAWKQMKALQTCPSGYQDTLADQLACVEALVRQKRIPPRILRGLRQLVDTAQGRGTDWGLEFPNANLAMDDKDQLILLDVIFNRRELQRVQMRGRVR